MDTSKQNLKIERIIETVAWPAAVLVLLYVSAFYPQQFSKQTELAYSGLILTLLLFYYYLAHNLLPLTKKHFTKNIADALFLITLLFLAIQTKSYISLILIIPMIAALLILGSFNSLIIATSGILLVGLEIVIENFLDINIYVEPSYIFIIISVIIIFYSRIISQRAGYEKRIKEEHETKLAITSQQLSALEYQGKEFTSLAAQQIFTPLATIQSFVQTIQSEKDGKLNIKQKEFIGETSKYVEKMHQLINELLFITKIEFNPSSFQIKPVDLLDTIKSSIKKFKADLEEKDLKLTLNYPNEDLPSIRADKSYLPEIFDRLIDNSIKYSKTGSQISVAMQILHKNDIPFINVEIKDNGCGIPQDEQKYMFKKFFRGTNIIENSNGNGLSLFIVKLLADRQNVIIHYKSKIDEGTTFHLDFPIS